MKYFLVLLMFSCQFNKGAVVSEDLLKKNEACEEYGEKVLKGHISTEKEILFTGDEKQGLELLGQVKWDYYEISTFLKQSLEKSSQNCTSDKAKAFIEAQDKLTCFLDLNEYIFFEGVIRKMTRDSWSKSSQELVANKVRDYIDQRMNSKANLLELAISINLLRQLSEHGLNKTPAPLLADLLKEVENASEGLIEKSNTEEIDEECGTIEMLASEISISEKISEKFKSLRK